MNLKVFCIPAGAFLREGISMNLIGRVISHFRDSSFDGDREDERIGKIDEGALCILRKLNDEGKEAYVVGAACGIFSWVWCPMTGI